MARKEVHCEDCIKILGEPFNYVHDWLDAYAKELHGQVRHRVIRHHLIGVEEVREMWGGRAAQAAKIHILRDFGLLDNPHIPEPELLIPEDESGTIRLLEIWLKDQGVI